MSSSVISTLFRFINFGLVCAVATYVFVKKILPSVKNKIAAKHTELQDIAAENKNLLEMQKEIQEEIDEQELLSRKLYDQISVWSSVFQKEQDLYRQEQALVVKRLRQRLDTQAEYKLHSQLRAAVLKKAFEGAQQELASFFASEKNGRQFVTSVIERMRKDLS